MAGQLQHPTAIVESQDIGENTRVWAYAHIMKNAEIGANCNIGSHTFIENGARIGNNVTLKNHVCVWQGVCLQDDVFVGPLVAFTNDLHPRSPRMSVVRERYADPANWLAPTLVERGTSIGANATIVAGIRLGNYSFIAAGSTVTKDVEPFALMIGCPARKVAFVCRCGHKLGDNLPSAPCSRCGTTPDFFTESIARRNCTP